MKTKSILAVAFAAMVTFASCSKEENTNSKNGETTRVVLNVEQATSLSRGTGSAIGAHTVEFTGGYVVFANSSNVATDVFKIVTGIAGEGEVNMSSGAIDFEDISGESRHVYILGNVGTLAITPGTTNMETLVSSPAVTAKSQTDNVNNSTVKAVALYGKTAAPINHAVTPSTAAVTVAPISSRIELAQFTGAGDVTSYKVEGIFINNFYQTITYKGTTNTVAGNDKFYLGKSQEADFKADGASAYSTADMGYFYNEDNSGLGNMSGLVCAPANGVWAYNVPAPVGGEFPHIVVRISADVTGSTPGETYWMTVTKFIYEGGPNDGQEVSSFEAGKIYKISNFEFSEENLDVAPEMKTVNAKVTVTLAQWEPISVKPW